MAILSKEVNYLPRTIITTCGTSLLKSCCWKYRGVYKNAILLSSSIKRDEIEKKEQDNNTSLKIAFNKSLNPADESKEDFYPLETGFYIKFWEEPEEFIRNLPAELASLKAVSYFFEQQQYPLGKDDEIILLPSDTIEGMFCAKVIYNVLKSEDYNLLPSVHIRNPEEWKPIGLDPLSGKKFKKAIEDIWKSYINKFGNSKREYIFNLTGGYKGIGFLLSSFAYAMGTNSKIFYLNEETNFRDILLMSFDPNESSSGFSKLIVDYIPAYPPKYPHLRNRTDYYG